MYLNLGLLDDLKESLDRDARERLSVEDNGEIYVLPGGRYAGHVEPGEVESTREYLGKRSPRKRARPGPLALSAGW